jgi:hypothetical protein
MKYVRLTCVAALMMFANAATANVFKCVSQDGSRTTYTDAPCKVPVVVIPTSLINEANKEPVQAPAPNKAIAAAPVFPAKTDNGITALVEYFSSQLSLLWKKISAPHNPREDTRQTIPPITSPRPTVPDQNFPENGSIIDYQKYVGDTAKFTVSSAQGRTENCVVKLETWSEQQPVIELFVRAGERAETEVVNLGDYRVKIACGRYWYGREQMFGRETSVSIGERPLKFWREGNKINGAVLTLTKSVGGNFKTNDSFFNKF